MNRRSGSWRSPAGLTLHTLEWQPDRAPEGIVVVAHGYAEHAGRYGPLAKALGERGLAVHSIDFPGHGRSAGPRGVVSSFPALIEDLTGFIASLRQEFAGLPIGLLGHSMGGSVSAAVAADNPGLIDALVLSSPYLRHAQPLPKTVVRLLPVLAGILPRLGLERLDPKSISRIPEEVEAYRTDPLVFHRRIPAATVRELFSGFAVVAGADRITVPLLVVHGANDLIAHPAGSRELVERAGSQDVTFELLPGGYHELFNDIGREQTTRLVAEWLEGRLRNAGSGRAEDS